MKLICGTSRSSGNLMWTSRTLNRHCRRTLKVVDFLDLRLRDYSSLQLKISGILYQCTARIETFNNSVPESCILDGLWPTLVRSQPSQQPPQKLLSSTWLGKESDFQSVASQLPQSLIKISSMNLATHCKTWLYCWQPKRVLTARESKALKTCLESSASSHNVLRKEGEYKYR